MRRNYTENTEKYQEDSIEFFCEFCAISVFSAFLNFEFHQSTNIIEGE